MNTYDGLGEAMSRAMQFEKLRRELRAVFHANADYVSTVTTAELIEVMSLAVSDVPLDEGSDPGE